MRASNPTTGVLGIDTATADSAVALTLGPELAFERAAAPAESGRPRHAEALLAEVEAAVDAAGGWRRVDLIAVGRGPGTFTGLRIGIATARALAQARGLPLAGVGSLAALARGIDGGPDRSRLALLDARRGELFAALLGPGGEPLWEPFVAGPELLASRLAERRDSPLAAGDGSLRFRAQLEAAGVEVLPAADPAHRMSARHVCALAAGVEPGRPQELEPIYLRRPDAEVWRERGNRDPESGRS